MSFEIGDIVECIDVSGGTNIHLVLHRKYIVYGVDYCCKQVIDVGLKIAYSYSRCRACGNVHGLYGETAWLNASRFRKIEPSYKVVEVTETISEQIKELIQN